MYDDDDDDDDGVDVDDVDDDELNLLKTSFCFDDGVVGVVLVPIISFCCWILAMVFVNGLAMPRWNGL